MVSNLFTWDHAPEIIAVFGVVAVLAAAIAGLLLTPERFTVSVPRSRADYLISDWADSAGYQLLAVSPGTLVDKPAAGEFGFGHRGRAGLVRRLTVRTPEGDVREGWAFVAVSAPAARVPRTDEPDFAGDFLEVAWDE